MYHVVKLPDSVAIMADAVREGYYSGRVGYKSACVSLSAMFCEHLSSEYGGVTRRFLARKLARSYLKPDISGMLEAYEG